MRLTRVVTLALAGLLAAVAPAIARAANPVVVDYDLDSTTYVCPVLCTPPSGTSCGPDARGYSDARRITTAGASTTTLAALDDNAFELVATGDLMSISGRPSLAPVWRRVTNAISADSIVVDSAVTIADADNARFTLFRLSVAGGTNDGWFSWSSTGSGEVFLSVNQISVTGGIDYKVEARQCIGGGPVCTLPVQLAGPTNVTAAAAARVSLDTEMVDQVRACFKVGTSDANDNITITAGTNDDIDLTEGTTGAAVATLTAGVYTTGAALATEAQTKINAAATDNTYTVTYSASTGKLTIARATGTDTIDFPWITGANAATSAAAALGFTADDAGATTYTADAALDFGDPASETEKITVTVIRK